MENGNGGHPANGNGHANGYVVPLRSIRYGVHEEEPRIRYSPSSRISRCPYRTTYTYPNELVLSLDDERRQLVNTNRALFQEIKELNALIDVQSARIIDLGGTVVDERTRTGVAGVELQRIGARSARVGEEDLGRWDFSRHHHIDRRGNRGCREPGS